MRAVTILSLAILLSACSGCGEALVNAFTFHPEEGAQVSTDAFGAPIEEVWLTAGDGVRLHAYFIPSDKSDLAVLMFHGNAGNASHRLPDAVGLWELGVSVLLLDYRGYGLSEGKPSEEGVYLDARAAMAYMVGDRGFPERRIAIYGRSLGTAVAVDLARGRKLSGVILVAPMSTGKDVVEKSGLGWLAIGVGEPFDSMSKIDEIEAPLLIFHGPDDEVIPIDLGRKLFDAATVEKEFVVVDGAGHNDLVGFAPGLYYEKIRAFLEKAKERVSSSSSPR